jgi:uncharacterized protein YukE
MGDITRVDGPGLRAAQTHVAELAGEIDAMLARLVGALDAEGACWGSDETGRTFADTYVPAVASLRTASTDLRDGVAAIAGSLLTVADAADSVDDRARTRLS